MDMQELKSLIYQGEKVDIECKAGRKICNARNRESKEADGGFLEYYQW